MHELSVASNIVEMVSERAKDEGGEKVTRVELEIGEMSGIEIYALEFAWDIAVKESIMEGAELIINKVPGKARCADCRHEFDVKAFYDPCPSCGSFRVEVIKGKELRVISFYVD